MKAFVDLPVEDQAVTVLVQLLEDVALGRRTMAGVEAHMGDLFNLVSEAFDVPVKEVQLVAEKVAKYGITMLPGYQEVPNGAIEGTASRN